VLGNYFLTKNDTAKADSLFNIVYKNFQDQSVVNSAATILKRPLINLDYDPAQALYVNAEKQMLKQDFEKSLDGFKNIYENYPSSPRAPKALYASGWILENELLKPDSAAEVYDTLKAKYPTSEYAKNILPKLAEYHSEKERIKKAVEDSLKALSQRKNSVATATADSIKNGVKNIPEEMLKKLPPGLRFEARRDSTPKSVDEKRDLLKGEKKKLLELSGKRIKEDSSMPKKKDEPADTLETK
jgi:tetratricopeptide (TPR) repeat protein